ncbi:hypothetical protein HET69_14770 [Streptomyces sp. CJ_13]|uniref:hypothetical protein n=1 Tax=Streptomyces sp. CJ_13 TaxID=2724943 RepID=UPI001BDD7E25|nr:hypothetical protein [Streptomyces sp. CJ_13]MBT1185235.1 hypothetical protein [Streptomyces sp. CJ_13]
MCTGIGGPADDERVFPAALVALGHQLWAAVITAASAHLAHQMHHSAELLEGRFQ